MNGYVVARGHEVGVPTPVSAAVVGLVREIDAGARTPSPSLIDQALQAAGFWRGGGQKRMVAEWVATGRRLCPARRAVPMAEDREYIEVALHGRGGQGVKTAGDLVVYALSAAGYRVNGQPLYGGERMGAPVMYFIRFKRSATPIDDRSLVRQPQVMLIFDATMLAATPRMVASLDPGGVLLVNSRKTAEELALLGRRVATVRASQIAKECGLVRGSVPIVGPVMVGAFARLTGLVSLPTLEQCVEKVTGDMPQDRIEGNFTGLRRGYEAVAPLAWRGGERA
ncbi:MAG: hypothetical protein A2X51_09575 [Candidatus Rokubacteria bacterium GWC2_70_24]|nr:MAG: hypothetical protein A2X53_04485 [Candidatus Rokubacteria bacterium GWA2_70_23]OGK89199.1 MAG: hypothetical protein A2X51_09575 [Candidatus Rokubacteria bacterium GWC2_70_24]OGK90419.1 MAG: hypothetical protein A2X50_02600 [Candidatus Rokubacteria bacterium GWF2_70_14]HAM59419.1 hypothetical protein [Candidatus Rokubacteria bacterium]